MTQRTHRGDTAGNDAAVLDRDGLAALIAGLSAAGFSVIGPRIADGAVVLDEITDIADLPAGWRVDQAPGRVETRPADPDAPPHLFDTVLPAQGLKRYLYPPRRRLWQADRDAAGGWHLSDEDAQPPPALAFLGLRPCELAAVAVQDRVFLEGPYADSDYAARRRRAVLIAVNCTRAAATCFCASMGTGPRATAGYDLALTEIPDPDAPRFLAEAGSDRGRALLADLPQRSADPTDRAAADAATAEATRQMDPANGGRAMIGDVADLLRRTLDHPHWDRVAERCLGCTNCTLVCPTCFCATVEDETTLDGATATRWRRWDSCFAVGFSYMHGGSVRREMSARYRQWMTHKLAHWHDQFGVSGCVGCGRCIAWCPVGIDITAEAQAIAASEER